MTKVLFLYMLCATINGYAIVKTLPRTHILSCFGLYVSSGFAFPNDVQSLMFTIFTISNEPNELFALIK